MGITRDGRLLDVNPALCRITGFSREDLVARAHLIEVLAHEASVAMARTALLPAGRR